MKSRKNRFTLYAALAFAAIAAVAAIFVSRSGSADIAVAALAKDTHFHGIAVDAADPTRLYLATHHGLYAADAAGKARRISDTRDDFMGFTAHPANPSALLASGHPANGGNLGVIVSRDSGRSWDRISNGSGGPVDFHQMDVSKAEPRVVYGVYGDLQRSSDEGRTWTRVGPAPRGIIGLAASSVDADTLYAATQAGLQRSVDGGRSWSQESDSPTTMVHVTRDGKIYAYMVEIGLVRATEKKQLSWQTVSKGFGEDHVLHFAADPVDQQRLYAVTFNSRIRLQSLIATRDGGASWTRLGGE